MQVGISQTNVWKIMKNDLELCRYKILIETLLSDDQKSKREKLQTGLEQIFEKKTL